MARCALIFFLILSYSTSAQIITIFAGTGGGYSGDGGTATAAGIPDPGGGAFDKYGNYYFVNQLPGQRVRCISYTGVISTIAGNGSAGFSGDGGPATLAILNQPNAVALDTLGNIYVADQANHRIRKIDATSGIIMTVVGNGIGAYGGDNGPATAAMIYGPQDICFDKHGNLFIADVYNHRIRKVDPSGIITTIVGTGTAGTSGDNGPATAAEIRSPTGIAVDDTGNLFFADNIEHYVRKVNSIGVINTIAGNGVYIYTGDNIPATAAQINPGKLAINMSGELFIADDYNRRVFKIDNAGIIHCIAGTGGVGVIGNGGPATNATLDFPSGLAFDACGNLYITEANNQLVRKITYPPTLTIPTITIASEPTAALTGTSVTVTATVANVGSSYLIRWFNHSVQFATTTTPSVTYIKGPGTDLITARVVSTATYGCYDSTTSAEHVITDSTSSVEDITAIPCSIWPNPISSELHIYPGNNSKGQYAQHYKIISAVGAMMLEGPLHDGDNSMPIAFLPSGIYMVEVQDPSGFRTVKKIIKQ